MAETVACERCGLRAGLVSQIAPFGPQKGARIFGCTDCKHFTWIDWHGNSGGQQQQQRQPDKG
jgi:hypothetical protein